MAELAIDAETGRRRPPAAEDLFPLVKGPTVEANKGLDPFVAGKPEFFRVLQARRGSFAPVRIAPYEREANTPHVRDLEDVFVEEVTFARPINVGGLPVLEFRQQTTARDDGPSGFRWQFDVAASPSDVGELLITQCGAPLQAGYCDWVTGSEKVREKSGVSGSLLVEPDEGEAKDFRLLLAEETFGPAQLGPPPARDGNKVIKALLQKASTGHVPGFTM